MVTPAIKIIIDLLLLLLHSLKRSIMHHESIESQLITKDNHFVVWKKHSTDFCIFIVESVIK